MADTINDIRDEAEVRHNPAGGNGYVLRSDIIKIKHILGDSFSADTLKEALAGFTFLPEQDRQKIIDDIDSYNYDY